MTAAAPYQLAQLGLDREHFRPADSKSWRGPCPRCGGERRFLLFTDKPFPKWNYTCSGCGINGWADMLNTALRQEISPEQRAEWARQNALEREAQARRRAARLAEFTIEELWAELHGRLSEEHRRQWETWGVPRSWQDHLQIGFEPCKVYLGNDGQKHTSPAFALPYFHTGFEFRTLQYRLADPDHPADRYRFEAGLGTTYYQTEPNEPIGDNVLICEGAKKGIVAHVYGQTGATVLAVPSKADFGGVVEAVRECGRVTVLLDPDAEHRAHKLAREIGQQARVATLPAKVDDVLLAGGQAALSATLKWARPM